MPRHQRPRKPVERANTSNNHPICTFFELAKIINHHRLRKASVTFKVLRGPKITIIATYQHKIVITKLPLRPNFALVNTYDRFPWRFPPVILAYFRPAGQHKGIENF